MIDFSKYTDKTIRVTKIKDNVFDNQHPNGINEGYIKEGMINLELSEKHKCLFIHPEKDEYFHTSEIKKTIENEDFDLFYTVNSIYKVEILK
jgi:hypothetical protein